MVSIRASIIAPTGSFSPARAKATVFMFKSRRSASILLNLLATTSSGRPIASSTSARNLVSAEDRFQAASRCGVGESVELSLFLDEFGGTHESAPGSPRQRPAHAHAPHAQCRDFLHGQVGVEAHE